MTETPRMLANVVMRAAKSDSRIWTIWLPTLREITRSVAAGRPEIGIDEIARRTGKSHNGVRRDIARFRFGGYLRAVHEKGGTPTRYELTLPSSEERARDLSRADLWGARKFQDPVDADRNQIDGDRHAAAVAAKVEEFRQIAFGIPDEGLSDRQLAAPNLIEGEAWARLRFEGARNRMLERGGMRIFGSVSV